MSQTDAGLFVVRVGVDVARKTEPGVNAGSWRGSWTCKWLS